MINNGLTGKLLFATIYVEYENLGAKMSLFQNAPVAESIARLPARVADAKRRGEKELFIGWAHYTTTKNWWRNFLYQDLGILRRKWLTEECKELLCALKTAGHNVRIKYVDWSSDHETLMPAIYIYL